MASTDATPVPIKNQAYRITFPMLDADGDLVTGATTPDSEVSKDGGTFADCTNEATEIATNSGMYYLDLTATEMNADTVALIIKSATAGMKTTPIVLYPVETGDIPVNVTAMASGVITATVIATDAIGALELADGAITAATFAAGAIDATAIAADAITAAKVASDVGVEFADALLNRDMSVGTDSGSTTVRTVRQALRALRNKVSIAAGTATVTKEDDSTASWTAAITTDAAGLPIIGVDPAGP